MPNQFADAIWPEEEIGQLVQALAARTALDPRPCPPPPPPDPAKIDQWFDSVCAQMGLESEPVLLHGADAAETLRAAAPAVIRVPGGYVGLIATRRRAWTSSSNWARTPIS